MGDWLLSLLDAVLIAPYRWPSGPVWGWWLGTVLLAVWCTALGELTLAMVYRVNRRYVVRANRAMTRHQDQSFNALKAGDKSAYKVINKLANEAFGKSFFLQLAMGASSIWPAFMGLAWLQARFQGVEIPLPLVGLALNYAAGFICCYILIRVAAWRLKKLVGIKAPGKSV